jgi:hypothetical protein
VSDRLTEPTFDADGYPTDETLDRITTWPTDSFAAMHAAMDFAGRAWSYPKYWEVDPEFAAGEYVGQRPLRRYVFSTGGWSGNESIVAAIEANQMLQMLGAWSWRRGGHYEYRFPAADPSGDAEAGT